MPQDDGFANVAQAGPVASFPMTDGWTEDPTADGVVLVGDAAGWSDPTIGQGLSVSMRDVRVVSELLLSDPRWRREMFKPYTEERGGADAAPSDHLGNHARGSLRLL